MALQVVVLAAGQGKRMFSDLPKVLHPLAGRPLLSHVLDAARRLKPGRLCVVIGHGADAIRQRIQDSDIVWALQKEQHGTGHAVMQAMPHLGDSGTVLVLYGDVPLIDAKTLASLVEAAEGGRLALLTQELEQPKGYGRIVRDGDSEFWVGQTCFGIYEPTTFGMEFAPQKTAHAVPPLLRVVGGHVTDYQRAQPEPRKRCEDRCPAEGKGVRTVAVGAEQPRQRQRDREVEHERDAIEEPRPNCSTTDRPDPTTTKPDSGRVDDRGWRHVAREATPTGFLRATMSR